MSMVVNWFVLLIVILSDNALGFSLKDGILFNGKFNFGIFPGINVSQVSQT